MNAEVYAKKHPNYWSKESINKEIKQLLNTNTFRTVIDIGCGNGSLLYSLKELGYLSRYEEVWAVDLSSNRLSDVRKISKTIKVVQDDAQELTHIPSNHFDLVISTQVIEHVISDTAMLRSLYRICKIGARIYLDTVYKKSYAWYFYKNQHGKVVLDPTHLREYISDEELLPKIMEVGFNIISSTKSLQTFPLMDFWLRRVNVKDVSLYQRRSLTLLRKIKFPILGYYCWKLILMK